MLRLHSHTAIDRLWDAGDVAATEYRSVPWLYADGKLENLLEFDLLSVHQDETDAALIYQRYDLWPREDANGEDNPPYAWVPKIQPGLYNVEVVDLDGNPLECKARLWEAGDRILGLVCLPEDAVGAMWQEPWYGKRPRVI